MEVSTIIDGINARKSAMQMTNQQIADASGVPKTTVDRILRKSTDNPSFQSIMAIAQAVGYEFGVPAAAQAPEVITENPHFRHIITMYEKQIADLRRDHNMVCAEKNRWIRTLAIIVGILITGIMVLLVLDILHPDIGWIRQSLGISGAIRDGFLNLISMFN